MIYSGKIPSIQPEEGVWIKQEGKEGGGLMQWNQANLTTPKVARHHWSTNEQQIYVLGKATYEDKRLCKLLPHLQEVQLWQWHLPVSFSNTKENDFYVPSQHVFLSPPLPSHPYSYHLTSSGPTLTHYLKNQASNFILSFSPALGYISDSNVPDPQSTLFFSQMDNEQIPVSLFSL